MTTTTRSGPGPRFLRTLEALGQEAGLDDDARAELVEQLHAVVDDATTQTRRVIAEDYARVLHEREARADAAARADVAHEAADALNAMEKLDGLLADSDLAVGTRPVHRRLDRLFEVLGCERIATVGATYDPQVHLCVAESEDGPYAVVLEEVSAGYVCGDQVIRPARVVVGIA